jgi:hypothetical protein
MNSHSLSANTLFCQLFSVLILRTIALIFLHLFPDTSVNLYLKPSTAAWLAAASPACQQQKYHNEMSQWENYESPC